MRKHRYEDDAYPPQPPLSPGLYLPRSVLECDTFCAVTSECTVHLRVLGLPVGVVITAKDLKNA